MTRRRRHSTVLLILPVLVLGACGGSAKKADPAADLAIAKASVLTKADLPGYSEKPYKKAGDVPDAVKRNFATCAGVEVTSFDDTLGAQKVHSSDFEKDRALVSSSIQIDPVKSHIDLAWSVLTKSGTDRCLLLLFEAILQIGAPSGAVFGATTITKFDPGVGDRSVGYAFKIPASAGTTNIVFYADLVFATRGRAAIQLTAFNLGLPFDRATEITLARAMYDRIGTAAG
jgi:hypothetical protein